MEQWGGTKSNSENSQPLQQEYPGSECHEAWGSRCVVVLTSLGQPPVECEGIFTVVALQAVETAISERQTKASLV